MEHNVEKLEDMNNFDVEDQEFLDLVATFGEGFIDMSIFHMFNESEIPDLPKLVDN
jgi:hypothetical protein